MTPSDDAAVPEPDRPHNTRVPQRLFILVPTLFLLSLAVLIVGQWDEFNPFWDRTPEFREAQNLAVTLHARQLVDPEFGRALQLCELGNVRARADAVSVVEESVKRNPARGELAAEVMKRVAWARNARLREAAERALKRIDVRHDPR